MLKKSIAIIGGGSSSLIAAYYLSQAYNVTIYEKEKTIGQKFLVAGKGGFNITNSLNGQNLADKYSPKNFLKRAILNFDSIAVINWLTNLEIQTFTGTSGRVYVAKDTKPIEVLNRIKSALKIKEVKFITNSPFIGFDSQIKPIIYYENKSLTLNADYYIFALGGSSWSITGSDGEWLNHFNKLGIDTKIFEPSNCGVNIKWSENINKHHLGKALKNIEIQMKNLNATGEAVLTNYGLEGNAIYSVIPGIRDSLKQGDTEIYIDLKPNNTKQELLTKLQIGEMNSNKYKKLLNLTSVQLSLIKSKLTKEDFFVPTKFVSKLKKLNLTIDSLRPIDEAISTVGGICTAELNPDFSLKKYPNIFTIGEMVDWDAPTGGFLLQGCFSMGVETANSLLAKV